MVDTANKDPVGYDAFYKDYSLFFKEGIVTSQNPLEKVCLSFLIKNYWWHVDEMNIDIIVNIWFQEEIGKLLRFESSKLEAGVKTSLADYNARQTNNDRNIYYLAAPR